MSSVIARSMFVTILLHVFVSLGVSAQGRLSGIITVEGNGEPMPGAHVILRETGKGTVSDRFGNYNLNNVPTGVYNVDVTFVGYDPVSSVVTIRNDSTSIVNVAMVDGSFRLDDVVVTANDGSTNTLSSVDIKLRPINSSQDILRMVPGLFIAQHAGGGKAEQIFLRGFDIDHGTDINLEVDGLPVNMVSHAHGQGYSDLHFVIPELINHVDFNKGPYYADRGDFTTAGYVDFQTKNVLDDNLVKIEDGGFGAMRGVVGLGLTSSQKGRTTGYIASEFFRTNGYVESPQDFFRFNVMSRLSTRVGEKDRIILGLTSFNSRWNASGQIPQRAVDNGMITRFGSIDNTEGGETSRINLYFKHAHEFSKEGDYFTQQAYAVAYGFNLFSNFTFYLNDPVSGDQIQQNESRMVYGYTGKYNTSRSLFGKPLRMEAGVGLRIDYVNDIRLSHTIKREFLNDSKRGDIFESNVNAFVSEVLDLTEKLSVTTAVRFDHFQFRYSDQLLNTNLSAGKSIISPKFNIRYQVNTKTQFYVHSGFGFHSNDARGVVERDGIDILPRAFGVDVGSNSKLTEKLLLNVALWRLDLEQEFVYVGDEGIVEPGGRTRREGIDLSLRYEISPWLFADMDLNFTRPRSKDEPESNNYIPLAPTFSTIGGLTFILKNGLNGSLRYRYMSNRPANEDKSVVADGYVLVDAMLNYSMPKFEVGLSAENLFNVAWNEAQFDIESKLKDEAQPVSEIHFTPGTPFYAKLRVTFLF